MLALAMRLSRFDSLSAGLSWTLVDESPVITIRFELENDAGGLRWTGYQRHGIQKVRGSNPLGSTKFLNTKLFREAGLAIRTWAFDSLTDSQMDAGDARARNVRHRI